MIAAALFLTYMEKLKIASLFDLSPNLSSVLTAHRIQKSEDY